MKKRLHHALCLLLLSIGIQAQVANYTFSTSTGAYTPITGGTVLVSGTFDNALSGAVSIPSFTYNGTAYSQVYVTANGYLTFGLAPASSNYEPISSTASYSGAISAMGCDIQNATSGTPEVRYALVGNEFVAQWQDVREYGTAGERISFQIRLNTATNAINIIYGGTITPGGDLTGREIGLRGLNNTYDNNTNSLMIGDIPTGTSCDWSNVVTAFANNSTMYFYNGNPSVVPANGLTFSWVPPAAAVAPVRAFGAVSAITLTSADLSWTSASGATQYDVQYRIPGTCAWTNFSGNPVTTTSVSLTGLAHSTVYQIRVQSSNGTNTSIWSHIPNTAGTGNGYSATGTFKTLSPPCAAPTAQPGNLVFNSVASTSVGATFSAPSPTVTSYLVLRTQGSVPNPPTNGVTYPTGASAALNGTVVSVGTSATISDVGLAGNTNYTYFIYACNSTSTCAPVYLPTSPLSGTVTTCPATPGAGTILGVGVSAFTLSWGSSVGGGVLPVTYTVDVATNNTFATPVAGSPFVVAAPTSSVNIPGLTANTLYFYRIRSGNGCNSAYTGTASVTTRCNALSSLPYFENFESVTAPALPTCWTVINSNNDADYWVSYNDATYAKSGTKSVGIYTDYNAGLNDDWLILPPIALTGNQQLKYWIRARSASEPNNYTVKLSTAGADPAAFTNTLLPLTSVSNTTYVEKIINLSGITGTVNIAFHMPPGGLDGYYLYIDDVTIETIPTCFPPTALTTGSITSAAVNLSWTAPTAGTPTRYIYEVRSSGAAGSGATGLASTGTVSVPTTSVTVTGLAATTSYSVYVRSDCGGGDLSIWSVLKTFTTTVSCPMPTTLTLSAITSTSAAATWTAGTTETSWLLKYSAPTTTVFVSGTPSYTMAGLTPNTSYSVQVKGICGVGDSSAWTSAKTFMTPCLPPNITSTTPGSRCGIGTMTLGATGDPGATLKWYTGATGGTAVATGSVFTTPTLNTSTNYYVSATGSASSASVGPLSPTTHGGTQATGTVAWDVNFTVLQNVTLQSLDIYPITSGQSAVLYIDNTAGSRFATINYITNVSGGTTVQTLMINAVLPAGTYKILSTTALPSGGLKRNTSGSAYPYTSSSINITGNGYDANYYMYYYNWIYSSGCESARTLVSASVTPPPALSVTAPATVCANTISTASVTSPVSNYDSYTWAPVTNLYTDAAATTAYTGGTATVLYYKSATAASAVYTVSATNAASSCANIATTTLTTFVPTFTASLTPSVICSGAAVTLSATAGANTGNYTWQWNPGALTGNTVSINPVNMGTAGANASYTVMATHPGTSCTNTAVVTVSVNPVPVAPVAHHSTQCGFGVPTASVTGTGGTYKWYAAPTGTTVLQSSVSITYTTAVGTSTTFYVSELIGSCEGPRAAVNVTVTTPDALTAMVSTGTICPNAAVTLSVTKTGSANTYTYSWTASPVAGSGIPISVSGSTAMITPSTSGLYTYTVLGSDAGTGCNTISTITLNVIAPPATPTVSPATPSVCAGSTATLTALGASVTSSLITENFEGGTLGSFSVVNLANHTSGTVTQWAVRTSPYNGWTGATAINSGSSKFASTNNDAGSSGQKSNSCLVSGVVNTNGLTALNLNFRHFFDYFNYEAPDSCYLEVTTNGTNWTTVKTYTADVATSTSFGAESVALNAYVNQPTFQVRFRFRSGWNYGWCLDDIALLGTQPSPSVSYSWSPGTGLSATTGTMVTANPTSTTVYTITADNGSCTSSSAFTLTVKPVPTVTVAASTGSLCSGTTATLTAGGTATYSWMPAGGSASVAVVSPATSTIYTVTGTSLGCSATQTVSLNVTPTPTVVASATPTVICAGATVSLTASGATTYSWIPNSTGSGTTTATPTVSTTYTVSGTTAGCTNTRTLNVTVSNVPTMTITTTPTAGVLCTTGATATLTATGTPTAYVWSNGANTASTFVAPSATTVYTVTGTNACGVKTMTTSIAVATTPTIAASSSPTLTCANNPAVLTASATPGVTFSWNTGPGTASITVTPSQTTTYTVVATNACGSATATVLQIVSPCTGLEEVLNAGEIAIYPNPASDYVNITVPAGIASANTRVEVSDALGKLLITEAINTEVTTLRVTEWKDGVYFFKVITNNQPVKVGKVVKW